MGMMTVNLFLVGSNPFLLNQRIVGLNLHPLKATVARQDLIAIQESLDLKVTLGPPARVDRRLVEEVAQLPAGGVVVRHQVEVEVVHSQRRVGVLPCPAKVEHGQVEAALYQIEAGLVPVEAGRKQQVELVEDPRIDREADRTQNHHWN